MTDQLPTCGCRHHPGLSHEEYMDIEWEVRLEQRIQRVISTAAWVQAEKDALTDEGIARLQEKRRFMAAGVIRDASTLNEQARKRYEEARGAARLRLREIRKNGNRK